MSNFEKEVRESINRHCMENSSNTPDFILAEYLAACLKAFDAAVRARECWYGRSAGYGQKPTGNCATPQRLPTGE